MKGVRGGIIYSHMGHCSYHADDAVQYSVHHFAGNSIKSLLCEQQDYLDTNHVQCTTRKTVNSRRTRKKVTLRKETDVVVK